MERLSDFSSSTQVVSGRAETRFWIQGLQIRFNHYMHRVRAGAEGMDRAGGVGGAGVTEGGSLRV